MTAQLYSSGTCRSRANNLKVTQKSCFGPATLCNDLCCPLYLSQYKCLLFLPSAVCLSILPANTWHILLNMFVSTCKTLPSFSGHMIGRCISQLTKCLITPQMSKGKTHRTKAKSSEVFLRDHVCFTVLQSGKREWSHNFGVCLGVGTPRMKVGTSKTGTPNNVRPV